jgi:hypothetical protein
MKDPRTKAMLAKQPDLTRKARDYGGACQAPVFGPTGHRAMMLLALPCIILTPVRIG